MLVGVLNGGEIIMSPEQRQEDQQMAQEGEFLAETLLHLRLYDDTSPEEIDNMILAKRQERRIQTIGQTSINNF
jgi:hypothetical protein